MRRHVVTNGAAGNVDGAHRVDAAAAAGVAAADGTDLALAYSLVVDNEAVGNVQNARKGDAASDVDASPLEPGGVPDDRGPSQDIGQWDMGSRTDMQSAARGGAIANDRRVPNLEARPLIRWNGLRPGRADSPTT